MHVPDMPERLHSVIARAPARLDLGGGWTDVPPYCDEAGGRVCNVAIARLATVRPTATDAPPPATPLPPSRL